MQANKDQKHDKDENGNTMDAFAEMLHVMEIENLIRLRRRLEKVGRKRMVELLTDEIEEREALEKEQQEIEEREALEKRKTHKK